MLGSVTPAEKHKHRCRDLRGLCDLVNEDGTSADWPVHYNKFSTGTDDGPRGIAFSTVQSLHGQLGQIRKACKLTRPGGKGACRRLGGFPRGRGHVGALDY